MWQARPTYIKISLTHFLSSVNTLLSILSPSSVFFLFNSTPSSPISSPCSTSTQSGRSAYYDDLVNATAHHGDFTMVRNLLNKRIPDYCFNTSDTFRFLTHTTSLSSLDNLLRTLSCLDCDFLGKNTFDVLITRIFRLNPQEDSLCTVETMVNASFDLNTITFHSIRNFLTRRADSEEAQHIADLMRDYGAR